MMKKLITMAIVVTMITSLFSFAGVAASENVIFSDSFENGLDNWKFTNTKANDSNSMLSKDKASDGKNSVYVVDKSDTDAYGFITVDKYTAVPGATYTASFDYYNVEGVGAKVFFAFFGADSKRISSTSFGATATGAWKSISKEFVAPDNAATFCLYITGASKSMGQTYIDNVKVVSTAESKPATTTPAPTTPAPSQKEENVPAVTNGSVIYSESFENGLGNIKFSNDYSKEGNVEVVSTTASDGKNSLYLKDDSSEFTGSATIPLIKVTPGTTYTVSADFKQADSKNNIRIYVTVRDSAKASLFFKSFKENTTEWKTGTLTFVAPEGSVNMELRIAGVNSAVGGGYVDNVKVTASGETDKPEVKEETKLDKINKSSIVLFIGSPNALVNGSKTLIDKSNNKVIADTVDGRTLVPVRFIAENYGAEVGWDDPTQTVTLKLKDKTVTIVLNKNEIDIDGKKITIDVPAQTIQDRTMLPLRAFVEQVMGKTIFWDDRGLIVITDEAILDAAADKATIDTIIGNIK